MSVTIGSISAALLGEPCWPLPHQHMHMNKPALVILGVGCTLLSSFPNAFLGTSLKLHAVAVASSTVKT